MRYPETKESGCPPDCHICVAACPTRALSLRYPVEVMKQATQASARQFLEAISSQQELTAHP